MSMNHSGWQVALGLCVLATMACCGGGSSADSDASLGDTSLGDTSLGDTSVGDEVDPTSCGTDGGTPCCGEDLVSEVPPGPVFHAEVSTATVSGGAGVGVLDSVEAAASDATRRATCVGDPATGGSYQCRSSWSLTMDDGSSTRIESSLPVEDVSWLVGQTVYLATGEDDRNLVLHDASGRLLVWQVPRYDDFSAADVVPVTVGAGTGFLPFLLSVRVAPTEALCRKWTPPCWLQDVYALDVSVGADVRSLGPGESFEFVGDGLRYRVTDRILASRTRLMVAQCADFGRETWSFDVVALGPAP
ncbi:MAG: hypothetical protein GXP55_20670 [Deltaproteobacteria bacterium]|nr:hypothetical protein [Deltaproteobacteria bacterium]